MKKILFILTAFSFLFTACVQDEFTNELPKYDKDGNVILRFSGTAPAMKAVKTRSVDEDGWGLQSTYLYNFDGNHSYLGRTLVTVNEDEQTGGDNAVYNGTFEVSVPPSTRYIHLISNLNEKSLEGVHLGMDEVQLIASLKTSSSMMGYWGRMQLPTKTSSGKEEIDTEEVKKETITLVRNQACVQLGTSSGNFTVNAFELFNVYADGMVAPYHTVGDDAYAGFDYTERDPDQTDKLPYVTMPNEPLHASEDISIFENMSNAPKYIFEHPNNDEYSIYVILRGRFANGTSGADTDRDYYFKASLVTGEDKQPVEIWRNYRYNLNISGNFTPANGTTEINEAKNLRPVNNVWISLDNSHPKVSDGTNTLDVKKVLHVIQDAAATSHPFEIPYEYTGGYNNVTVSWLSNENIFNSTINTGEEGKIKVTPLHNPTDTPERATLLVKAGALRREISLILVKNFVFEGVWCSTNVGSSAKGQLVTLLFNIPQNFPPELFPLECRISTNGIDTKEATKLPIIALSDYIDETGQINTASIADGGWGGRFPLEDDLADNEQDLAESWGYKYVYTANEVGVQRVYFLTSIGYGSGTHPESGHIYVEATNFETTHKQYTFSSQDNWELKMVNTSVFNPDPVGNLDERHNVQYKLAAPVKGSQVSVEFQFLKNNNPVTNFNDQDMTDIMIFTNELEPMNPAEPYWKWYDAGGNLIEDGSSSYEPMTSPSNGGHYYVFNPAQGRKLFDGTGTFSVPFKTKIPLCADVIRIAVPEDDSYRSASFELSYFDPFYFVSDKDVSQGNTTHSIAAEYHTDISVELDVNSVERPVDGRVVSPTGGTMIEVSPGKTVDCYIYTNNFRVEGAEEISAGCYKFTATNYYNGGSYDNLTVNKLTLIPKDGKVVTAETVVVKSDETQVAFVPFEINVTNPPITGIISYGSDNSPIPQASKVDIITQRNGTRIGTFVIGENGTYTLRLKGEFDFGWEEALHLIYKADDGTTYQLSTTLKDIKDKNGNITLTQ